MDRKPDGTDSEEFRFLHSALALMSKNESSSQHWTPNRRQQRRLDGNLMVVGAIDMGAWVFQDHRQKQRLGDKAPWSAGWVDPEGKRRSKRLGSKSMAIKYARKIEGQLAAGTYESTARANWTDFVAVYESKVMAAKEPGTREATRYAIQHFTRIVKPVKMRSITSKSFDDYVATRRLEPSYRARASKPNTQTTAALEAGNHATAKSTRCVSPATVNKELRSLRAMIRKAVRWRYLARAPEIEFLKEPGKLPVFVTPEHFTLIYRACDAARRPADGPFTAAGWWRGLCMAAYMTGWRVGSLLALRWEHVDLEIGTAVSLAADNKGKRDQKIPLHPVVIEHLKKLRSFSPLVFPWPHTRRGLYGEFHAIQKAAGTKPTGPKPYYGFHDLRRAFATMNANKLTPDALQALMQHKDYKTTQRYINMVPQLDSAVAGLFVPSMAKV